MELLEAAGHGGNRARWIIQISKSICFPDLEINKILINVRAIYANDQFTVVTEALLNLLPASFTFSYKSNILIKYIPNYFTEPLLNLLPASFPFLYNTIKATF